ncbi:MAG: adenylosuccinate lyase [Actinomycetota bacterium]|nr:adenylosuccinate lyase [Actinomycetota bacterium]
MDMMVDALSPLDGRYAAQLTDFAAAFSEEALMRNRFAVEVRWLLTLAAIPQIVEFETVPVETAAVLERWVRDFGPGDLARIKAIEATTNHDVKAVEYYLKELLADIGFGPTAELVHFACTSEDINNLAHGLMLTEGLETAWLPLADGLVAEITALAEAHAAMAMPSHTHGQPATPTTLGKELAVFARRLARQASGIRAGELQGKLNGAVGTFGAHTVAFPEVDWIVVSRQFVTGLGLGWNPLTTQIEPHDSLAEILHGVVRFNTVLIDFCRDLWEYISRNYLRQQTIAGEVGSSTMPHKVNPIDFENAEANAGISSSLAEHLASKLMVSRMQRDLSDSSALRNLGVALGHSGLAIRSARRGLGRVAPDPAVMAAELDSQWEVLGEAIQTVMRRYGFDQPYERLKALTRGATVTEADVSAFIMGLDLPADAETRLLKLTPATYTGLAAELVRFVRE